MPFKKTISDSMQSFRPYFYPIVGQWKTRKLNYEKTKDNVDWIKSRDDPIMLTDSVGAENYIQKGLMEISQ